MNVESYKPHSADEVTAFDLYYSLLQAWNEKDAVSFARHFSGTAHVIGFDGSQMYGQAQIEKELKAIFSDHNTGTYKAKVRDVSHVCDDCLLLNAVAGMIPATENKINPSLNAVQSLVVAKKDGKWYIELFQNTPAQFHGRPELSKSLTQELSDLK